ncbi:SusC/RagA family TonB-linked outer membrane protein [Sinomicrobium weinanense]|uniref:SusC/RagA family TonB-linked outer membrane protein n=1 Tax=Sinomicrobium weinanense TaxID=2842200 RepID=A0A926JPC6_9FLAO|nr:SusC/RagA family TonB-linked outer membrane protein [Sinomicrobium weinanense]MBC9794998.1 SusC/RagA family TonB-linked outer membrane protein [Sinomicrobium weinanense]MBU3125141.1 SusC/RagA family TonB-linked outer membrane protein [Sinomicrobium weinanense]
MQRIRLLLLLLPVIGFSQTTRTITGQVFSKADGMPLPGASVYIDSRTIANETEVDGVIQSTSVGAVADFDGNFSLEIPGGTEKVTVSYVGFETQVIHLSSRSVYQIYLGEEMSTLNEVVVTGYQKVEKRKLTSSVSKVEMKDARQIGVSSADMLLQGQAAGVVVTPQTGAPGAPAKIRIRGTASLSGPQDPLWVVDGLPLEGNDVPDFGDKDNIDQLRNYAIAGINPDDIKDITILKDAAATAIYGARAANGVIVVTTKKGQKGRMSVNFSANTFYTMRPDFDKLNLMNASEKVDFELALARREDLDFRTDKGEVMRILNNAGELEMYRNNGFSALSGHTRASINRLKQNNTDWGDLLYRAAANTQYSLSISGGSEKSDYYFSLGYYDEEGTTVDTGFERYNITLKNNYDLSDKFKVGVSLFASQSGKESYVTGTDAFTNPANYSRNANPYLNPYNDDGSYRYDRDIEGFEGRYVPFNFLEERENTSYELKNSALKAIFDASYSITDDLRISTQLGLQADKNSTEKYASGDSYFTRKMRERTRRYDSELGDYYYFLPEGGVIQNWEESFFQYNWKSLLEYNTRISEKHEIDAMIGSELRRSDSKIIATQGFGYDPKTLTTTPIMFPNDDVANESTYEAYNRSRIENAYASFYATASYTYDRKYTVFGSVRYDGSNLFGVDPKYKYLPLWSTSASWLVSEEDFLKESRVISNLRLRASYGLQGNIDRNTSPFVIGEYGNASILPGTNEQTVVVTSPPNNKLRWEKTENYNIGTDIGLLGNRISIAFDMYKRRSSDLIGMKSVPLENGFEFTNLNWAQVTNKGFELALTTRNIVTKNFSWTTNINIAHNKSKVDKIQIRENSFLPSREGLPVNAVFALKTAGIDENGYPLFRKGDQKVSAVEFFDLIDPWAETLPGFYTQSGLSNEEFRDLFTYVGDRDPKYSGGIINNFSYKNFDFTVAASFNLKQTVVKNLPYNAAQVDRGQNYTTDILNAWSSTNTSSSLPGIVGETSGSGDSWMAYKWFADLNYVNTMSYLDTFVDEMSYLRISSIRMGYSLPDTVISKLNLDQVRFSLEGRNLFVISTDYSGYFDPETYGNIYAQPIPKSIALGLNVSF